jgi:D-beta-D-heptose 7-phosphate kinase/D-beta-D-heptose 1-phosphate adenosyltransferase
MEHGHKGKLRSLSQLMVEVASRRRDGQKVVFTNGVFDLLHTGHISLLEKSRQQGDMLIVAVNTDASVKRLKGPERPINTEIDRAMVLGALTCVDAVVLFEQDTPLELIRAVKPDVLIKGADYSKDKVVGADVVEAAGGKVVLIELVKDRSTTGTIGRMKK